MRRVLQLATWFLFVAAALSTAAQQPSIELPPASHDGMTRAEARGHTEPDHTEPLQMPALNVPGEVSFFEYPCIQITGLQPMIPITIRATAIDATGVTFTSSAQFVPHADGVVDTTKSIANGGYSGIDPMGLFWSMDGKGTFQPPIGGTVETTIDVIDEAGRTLASSKLQRRMIPADVKVTDLRRPDSAIAGRFYEHTGVKRAAILMIIGSNGGIDERVSPLLASKGYNVLSIAYHHFDGVSADLIEVPLEYFQSALQWLARQPSVEASRIGIVGVSKGSEAALLTAAHFPELVHAVGAMVPTAYVWEGADARARFGGDPHFDAPGKSSWSLDGKPLPFVHKYVSAQRLANRPTAFLDEYEPPLDHAVDPEAVIPVERIRAPVFLASAGDDFAWPSLRMARDIQNRLADHHFKYRVETHEYPQAGHGISPPGFRSGTALGGTLAENARAGADAWTHLIMFLDANLGSNSAAH
jgi:dienelactone hydrolase